MDPNVQIAIISGIVTILVGIITAFSAYRGAIKGATTQIEHEKQILKKKEDEQNAFTESAIQQFIMREVRYNFNIIIEDDFMMSRLAEQKPLQYGHNMEFKREEFERFKHKLIKSKTDLVERILLYYDTFLLLEEKFDLKILAQEEFEKIRDALKLFLKNDQL